MKIHHQNDITQTGFQNQPTSKNQDRNQIFLDLISSTINFYQDIFYLILTYKKHSSKVRIQGLISFISQLLHLTSETQNLQIFEMIQLSKKLNWGLGWINLGLFKFKFELDWRQNKFQANASQSLHIDDMIQETLSLCAYPQFQPLKIQAQQIIRIFQIIIAQEVQYLNQKNEVEWLILGILNMIKFQQCNEYSDYKLQIFNLSHKTPKEDQFQIPLNNTKEINKYINELQIKNQNIYEYMKICNKLSFQGQIDAIIATKAYLFSLTSNEFQCLLSYSRNLKPLKKNILIMNIMKIKHVAEYKQCHILSKISLFMQPINQNMKQNLSAHKTQSRIGLTLPSGFYCVYRGHQELGAHEEGVGIASTCSGFFPSQIQSCGMVDSRMQIQRAY